VIGFVNTAEIDETIKRINHALAEKRIVRPKRSVQTSAKQILML